jgi:molybdate transport system substrate-binding protein
MKKNIFLEPIQGHARSRGLLFLEKHISVFHQKKICRSSFFILLSLFIFISCQPDRPEKLTIATAANMQFAMDELTESFSEKTGFECEIIISSSGKLTAQIQSGAPFDVFVSANKKYPNKLHENSLTDGPPKIYAYGKLVLWSTSENISPDMEMLTTSTVEHIALANPKNAPYGLAAVEVLHQNDLFDVLENKLVYGESIAQVNQFVVSQAAEVGFTAMSVVLSPELKDKGKWMEINPDLHSPIEQGVVILKSSEHREKALSFVDFLFSAKGKSILKKYGYTVGD